MPSCARSEVILDGEIGYYHVWTRCVRRAFLCGKDRVTGKDFKHRRDWIHRYLPRLCQLFGIDAGFHVEMQNHLHLILKTRPDVVEGWSDELVARKWLEVNRLIHSRDGDTISEVTDEEIAYELKKEPGRAVKLRKNLCSVSQFMKALCEHVSRRANREDETTGAFFEGRFRARRIENTAGLLVCGIYVDLNQIRAGEALTPEKSTHTSAYDRIVGRTQRANNAPAAEHADCWLSELFEDPQSDKYQAGPQPSATGKRASDRGWLPIQVDEYLQLLDWSGRLVAKGKSGAIPKEVAPILERLKIATETTEHWRHLVTHFDRLFTHVVGTSEQLVERAAEAGRRFYRGRAACAAAFG